MLGVLGLEARRDLFQAIASRMVISRSAIGACYSAEPSFIISNAFMQEVLRIRTI